METKPKRRTFDESFKREAVALLLQGEKPVKQLATDLGVDAKSLRDWKKRFGPPEPVASREALELELRALRRENERLRTQRDILKKRWASLSNPGPTVRPHESLGDPPFHCRPVRRLWRVAQ